MKNTLKTWPERIYLQAGEGDDGLLPTFEEALQGEVTWCYDSVEDNEVEYVRADIAGKKNSEA